MKTFLISLLSLGAVAASAQRFTTIEEIAQILNSRKFALQIESIVGLPPLALDSEQINGQCFRVNPDNVDVRLVYFTRQDQFSDEDFTFDFNNMIEAFKEAYKAEDCQVAKNRQSAVFTINSNARIGNSTFSVRYRLTAYSNGKLDLAVSSAWFSEVMRYRGTLVKIVEQEQPQVEIQVKEVVRTN